MLQCNKYYYQLQGDNMDFQSLLERLQEMFPQQYQSDIEEFINSKDPKSAADVEHWMQEYTYHNNKNWLPNA